MRRAFKDRRAIEHPNGGYYGKTQKRDSPFRSPDRDDEGARGLGVWGKKEFRVSSGTFIACPPGAEHPHQLINASNEELRYLVVSTMEYPEIAEYPDSNKIGAYVTGASDGGFRALYHKNANVPYFEDESGSEIERIKKATK